MHSGHSGLPSEDRLSVRIPEPLISVSCWIYAATRLPVTLPLRSIPCLGHLQQLNIIRIFSNLAYLGLIVLFSSNATLSRNILGKTD